MNAARSCPACSVPVGASARFCAECGTPLAPPAEATAGGERRQLTILFCDLVGSTALSEQLDPEDLGEAVLAYQEMGRAVVTDLEGHVAQYLGDGLLVYFGYPVAHEDDAERAVLAGLRILDGIRDVGRKAFPDGGTALEARVGIHAGPAVVGAMGSADRSDTSAFGSTPNIAARLEGFATPGTVVVSDDVRRLLAERFETIDRGTPELKGISRPIRAWEVTAVREQPVRTSGGAPTAMVGRSEELRRVLDVIDRARAGQPGRLLVSAEPGVGKSRLLAEVADHVRATDAPGRWLEGQCSQLSSASPLAPVLAFLRQTLGLDATHEPDQRRARLVEALAVLGPGADRAAHRVGEVLGVPVPSPPGAADSAGTGAEARRREALDTLVAWVHALARTELVIVAVEDLHWADPSTVELLRMLADAPPGSHLVSFHTTRPGGEPWDDRFEVVELGALSAADSEQLARALGAVHGLDADAVDAIARRGDGVPLFIEELVRATDDVSFAANPEAVPTTLQALLAARLDSLGEARSVAQAASVLGREFADDLLAAVAPQAPDDLGRHLDALREAGLLSTRRTPAGMTHTFRHALIQDAAYSSLLRRQRRTLHGAVAAALTTRFAHVVDEAPEVVAHHLSRAGQLLEAGSWFVRAGRRAAERAALQEARAHFEAGIDATDGAEATEERQRLLLTQHVLLANVLMGSAGIGHEAALPRWLRAVELAEEVADSEALTAALNGLAVYHFDRGAQEEAERYARWVLDVGESTGCRIATLRGHGSIGLVRLYQGQAPRAIEHLSIARSHVREGDFHLVTFGLGHDQETFFHTIASWAEWWVGRPDQALATATDGLRAAQAIPSSLSQAMGRYSVAMIRHLRGDNEEAAVLARENMVFSQALGFPFWAGASQLLLGTQLARSGDPNGVDVVLDSVDRLAHTGNITGSSLGLAMLAEAYLHTGRFGEAVEAADLGLAAGDAMDQRFCHTELLAMKGRALLALGRSDDGRATLETSLEHGIREGAASAALQTACTLADVLADTDPRRARAVLLAALAAMHDGATTPDQRRARAALDDLAVTP